MRGFRQIVQYHTHTPCQKSALFLSQIGKHRPVLFPHILNKNNWNQTLLTSFPARDRATSLAFLISSLMSSVGPPDPFSLATLSSAAVLSGSVCCWSPWYFCKLAWIRSCSSLGIIQQENITVSTFVKFRTKLSLRSF